jgi:hypothetical protein
MAKGFGETNGEAKKGGIYYKYKDGTQILRLVGQIVPRYQYWKSTSEGKSLSIECLSFDRDAEKFTNVEKDWFQHYFPDAKCSWGYVAQIIDPEDNSRVILISLKKKYWQQVQTVANELGDPTDADNGWDLVLTKASTGPKAFNVEYTVEQLKCKPRALTNKERQAVADMGPIDKLVIRSTPEEQRTFIEKAFGVGNSGAKVRDENIDDEDADALSKDNSNFDDDIPF